MKNWVKSAWNSLRDRRACERIVAGVAATLGSPLGAHTVKVLDASASGVGVWSGEPRAKGSVVFLRFTETQLAGFVRVRHCSEREGGYFLGLEFCSALFRGRD